MPLVVAGAYAAISTIYIFASDRFLVLVADSYAHYELLQTYKGWAFVAITSLFLWIILSYAWGRINQTLRETLQLQRRFRLALDAAGGGVWEERSTHGGGESVHLSGRLAEQIGLNSEMDFRHAELRKLVHPEDLPTFDARVKSTDEPIEVVQDTTCRILANDGEYRWVRIVSEVIADHPDEPGQVVGVALDVTEQKDIAQQLQEIILGGELGTWRFDLPAQVIHINERWAEMLGYTKEELDPVSVEQWRAFLHPDDLQRMESAHEAQFSVGDYLFSNELRMRHRLGHWVWVLSRGRVTRFSASGEPVIMSGVHGDISARKSLEKDLQNERDFLLRLTETSISGILALDGDGVVLFVNKEAEAILGLTTDQMIGRTHDDPSWKITAPDGSPLGEHDFPFVRAVEQGIAFRDIRLRIVRPDGRNRIISVNVAPILDTNSPIRVVCSVTDITAQAEFQHSLARAAEAAQYAALHDQMTGLPNRELFREYLEAAIRLANSNTIELMLVFMDIDNFKQINDTYGHFNGDKLLLELSHRIASHQNTSDTMARIGGDEFTFLHQLQSGESAAEVLDPLVQELERPFLIDGGQVYLTVSFGVSIFRRDANDADEMLRNADLAMYQAKGNGRNQHVVFSSSLRAQMSQQAKVTQALQRALRDKTFSLVLQPKFSLNEPARVSGAEALLRCNDPLLQSIGPGEFIPVAEQAGLVRSIDLCVVDMLGGIKAAWKQQGIDLRVSINLSSESLRWSGFGDALVRRFHENRIGPDDVLIELTESALMDMSPTSKANMGSILAEGFDISADDFGTGYSSLSYLHLIQLRELKIDRSFIARLGAGVGASDSIVRAILAMARALGLRTVAEGVETEAQREWLQDQGCDEVQGFLFGAGMSVDAFTANFMMTKH
ncbi:sensor domain-containing protein [Rhodobacter ferrooxidans]|nr:GGDEF and EAL domain-containing protein [Rhodobacter sp. SW2]